MASTMDKSSPATFNKGAWTAEEDRKLAEVIATHGPTKWKTIAAKTGTIIHTHTYSIDMPPLRCMFDVI